jgi:diketogulonate reductase-like aldo/keto reductase
VALAALRQTRRYGRVIPIVGASKAEQLRDNLGCLDLVLSGEHVARLEVLSAPALCFPHAMLRGPIAESLTTGGAPGVLDNHRR